MFEISSVASDRKLILSQRRGDSFLAELSGHGINVILEVSAYTDAKGLLSWFEKLATFELPWEGQKSWATLEHEFQITASCSTGGSVFFQVKFYGLRGAVEEWRASAGIGSELGLLPGLAAKARAFFAN